MYCEKCFVVIIIVCIRYESFAINSETCGIDNSKSSLVNEGAENIETYPWLGVLIYPMGVNNKIVTTTIVLISKQMALAAALDIDRYPKNDFRSLSRVVLGRNCSGLYIKVIDYNYHPHFTRTTYNTFAMLQLDTLPVWKVLGLQSICPPPNLMRNAKVYAMTLTDDCSSGMVRVYKMEYVNLNECQEFYKRVNLDIKSMWPTHVTCARASRGGRCVWRSGAVLVMRDHDQWRLIGFSVNGPGCEAPARFLDYSMYYPWVKQSISRIGRPAITRIGPGHLILRRNLNNLQRFGECDNEEIKAELFNDFASINPVVLYKTNTITYNLTLMSNVDYTCVIMQVYGQESSAVAPRLTLRRWCSNPNPPCYDFSILQVNFKTEIHFLGNVIFEVKAYGKEIKFIDADQHKTYINEVYYADNMTLLQKDPKHPYFIKSKTKKPVLDVLFPMTGAKSVVVQALKSLLS